MSARKELANEGTVARAAALFRSKPRRYGGYLVHLGVVVMTVAITASMVYKIEQDISIEKGGSHEVASYRLTLREVREVPNPNYIAAVAVVDVFDRESGAHLGSLEPEQRFYPSSDQNTTEVDIHMTLKEDLYLALGAIESDGRASFKLFVNPLQIWLWFGSLIVGLGTLVVIVPKNAREPATSTATEANQVTA